MSGTFYGIGVGPGDPELMTLKAVRMIQEQKVIAVPGDTAEESVAYRIAVQAVPELANKKLLPIKMPMTKDRAEMMKSHESAAEWIASYLREGENVVFLTLGDPAIYSTCMYVAHRIRRMGFSTGLISGVPSFCAAAAAAHLSLAEWDEPLHIYPAVYELQDQLHSDGNYIFMKCGRRLGELKEMIKESNRSAVMVENCGMPSEHIYCSVEDFPEVTGYFSLVIAKDQDQEPFRKE